MAKSERPTLRSIAALSGLAVATVSRALADDSAIASETRQRVQSLARQLGYQPDRAAQRLRTGRSNVLALVLPPHEEILGYGSSMMRGMAQALRGTPYHLVVMPLYRDLPEEDTLRHIIRNRLADGVFLSRTRPDDLRIKLLLEEDMPFVCHGRTELARPHPWVDYDNDGFAQASVVRLVERGARRLALIGAPPGFTFAQHLRNGFLRGCAEAALEGRVLSEVNLDSTPEEIYAHISTLLKQKDAPEGFVCPGEVSALAVNAACVDAGHLNCHIVMKSTSEIAGFIRPQFDSLYEDLSQAGAKMAEILLRRLSCDETQTLTYLQAVQPLPALTGERK